MSRLCVGRLWLPPAPARRLAGAVPDLALGCTPRLVAVRLLSGVAWWCAGLVRA